MKRTLFICLSLIMLALVGCKKDENTWGKLKEGSVKVVVGDSLQLTFESNGNKYPQWSSADPFIARVNGDGVVFGDHVGVTTVCVNDLACKVTVEDKWWNDSTDVVDPVIMDYNMYPEDVEERESTLREYIIPEVVHDSVMVTYLKHDTVYTTPDSSKYNVIVTEEIRKDFEFVRFMRYDYSLSAAAYMVDNIEYHFDYTYDKKTGVYDTYLYTYTERISKKYENDIYEILDNRYYKTDDPNVYYYYLTARKICKIFVHKTDGRMYLTINPNAK